MRNIILVLFLLFSVSVFCQESTKDGILRDTLPCAVLYSDSSVEGSEVSWMEAQAVLKFQNNRFAGTESILDSNNEAIIGIYVWNYILIKDENE